MFAISACLGLVLVGGSPRPKSWAAEIHPSLKVADANGANAFVEAANDFGVKLFGLLTTKAGKPNALISPISLHVCMALLLESAKGPEREEMKTALGLGALPDADLGKKVQSLSEALRSDPEKPVSVANAVWLTVPVQVERAFSDRIKLQYEGEIRTSRGASAAQRAINAWVKGKTNGMIPKLVDQVDGTEIVFLLNAVAFEAQWEYRFDVAKKRSVQFLKSSGSIEQIPMMFGTLDAFSAYGKVYDGLRMDYRGGAYSMVALLPHSGKTPLDVLDAIRTQGFAQVLNSFRPSKAEVGFPKFRWEGGYQLNDALMTLGVRKAFGHLDQSPLSRQLAHSVFLSYVLQKTFIDVDEKGTKAAAATVAVTKGRGSMPLVFNRPFLYAIVHNKTGAILFLGICGDPTVEN